LLGSIFVPTLLYLCFTIATHNGKRLSLDEAKKPFRGLAKDWAIEQHGDFPTFAGQLVAKAKEQEIARRAICRQLRKAFNSSKDLDEGALVEVAVAISHGRQDAEQRAESLAQEIQNRERQLEEARKELEDARKVPADVIMKLTSALERAVELRAQAERALEAEKERTAIALRAEKQRSEATLQAEKANSAEREEAAKRKELDLQRRESELTQSLLRHDEDRQNFREQVEKERRDVEQLRKEADRQLAAARALEAAAAAKQAMVDDYPSLKARVESLSRDCDNASKEREAWRKKSDQLHTQFEEVRFQLTEATNKSRKLSAEVANIRQQLVDADKKILAVQRERDALVSSAEKLKSSIETFQQRLVLPRSSLPEFITGGALRNYGQILLQQTDDPALGAQARRLIGALFALEGEMPPDGDPKAIIEVLRTLGRYLYAWMEASNTDPSAIHGNVERWASVISDYCSSRRIKLKVFRVGEPINPVQMDRISGSSPSVSRIESWLVLHNDGIVRKALVYA
jgi:chromosome segregation ATPase